MEKVKQTSDYEIFKKRSGRYAVKSADRKWLNGVEKIKILVAEKLIKAEIPKEAPAKEEAPAEEAADTDAEEQAPKETPAEEPATEEPAAEEKTE